MKMLFLCSPVLFFAAFVAGGCIKNVEQDAAQKPAFNLNQQATSAQAATSTPGVCDYEMTEAALTGAGWKKVFDEQFSSDFSKWTIWNGGAYNNELQCYRAGNLTLANGVLAIEARKETVIGPTLPSDPTPKSFDFTSGRIETKTHFSASNTSPKVRMAARIKLPTGLGMWPAFWSYGDPWPTQGEIDIMEARGNEPFKYQTAYWYGRKAGLNQASNTEGYVTSATSLTDCWHVYEVVWEKNALSFYLDGQLVVSKSGGLIPNFFRKT